MRKIALALLLTAAGTGIASGSAHAASDTAKKDQPIKHVVAGGESLSSIATDNKLTDWRPIWNANADLQDPDTINPGQELVIPKPDEKTTERPLPGSYGATAPVAAAPVASQRSYQPARTGGNAASGDVLARIRARESGGNYATNTGNGYYGAYQYNDGTWGGYGGYAHASDAPASVQDAKAAETYAARGCSPWPNTCY